jgi:hypothetical protein
MFLNSSSAFYFAFSYFKFAGISFKSRPGLKVTFPLLTSEALNFSTVYAPGYALTMTDTDPFEAPSTFQSFFN